MLQISADILALSGEAALLIKYGKVVFANKAAADLLGYDCTGKTLKSMFGDDVAEMQAGSFIGSVNISGRNLILRVASSDGVKAVFLTKHEEVSALISDACIFSLRSSLMMLGVSLDTARNKAQSVDSPELMKAITSLTHEYYKISRVVSNVSIINGIENKTLYYGLKNIDLTDLISSIIVSLRSLLNGPDIILSAPEHLFIFADPSLIQALFLNLISNSLNHAHGYSRISVTLVESKGRVMLSVDDDGCGIPSDLMHTVFDRYRHSFDLSNMSGGSGFGLTAARAIAHLHDGTILLESRENIGTAVRVSLSKNPAQPQTLHEQGGKYETNSQSLLVALANCLPDEYFSEKYVE